MLLDIFVTVPLLLMTNIACYMRVGIVLICLIVLLAERLAQPASYRVREDDTVP